MACSSFSTFFQSYHNGLFVIFNIFSIISQWLAHHFQQFFNHITMACSSFSTFFSIITQWLLHRFQHFFNHITMVCSSFSTILQSYHNGESIVSTNFQYDYGLFITFSNFSIIRGSFFMFVESGCISLNIEFTVP